MPGGGGGGKGKNSGQQESAEARELYRVQAALSREAWDQWKQIGLPQLRTLANEVDATNVKGEAAHEQGLAATDVAQSYDRSEEGLRSDLARYNVKPGSGRFMSGLRSLSLGRAADTAGAKSGARMGVLERMFNKRLGVLGAAQGQASTALGGLAGAARGLGGLAGQKMQASSQRESGMWSGIGALAGGALMAFSDRRLKRDIREIGELRNGLTVYEFRFIDEPDQAYTGLMADEVLDVMPQYVDHALGYLTVDYRGLLQEVMAA